MTKEILQREARILTEEVHVDLDADAATRLDANDATDDSDFVAGKGNEECDL